MDHEHGHRGHQYLRTCHSDDGCCGCRNAIDFHGHITLVVHEHIVDLGCRHAVTAGAVDPDSDVAGVRHQFVLEKLRRDVIVKPTFLGDGPVQKQRPLLNLLLCLLIGHRSGLPIPEFLHRIFPPFRHR